MRIERWQLLQDMSRSMDETELLFRRWCNVAWRDVLQSQVNGKNGDLTHENSALPTLNDKGRSLAVELWQKNDVRWEESWYKLTRQCVSELVNAIQMLSGRSEAIAALNSPEFIVSEFAKEVVLSQITSGTDARNACNENIDLRKRFAESPGQVEASLAFRQWALQDFTEDEIVAGYRDIKQDGGHVLEDFLPELEQIVASS